MADRYVVSGGPAGYVVVEVESNKIVSGPWQTRTMAERMAEWMNKNR